MVIDLQDIEALRDSALERFEEALVKAEADSIAVEREITRLESKLEQLYSFTALMARREADVAATAALWRKFVQTCDLFASRVHEFSQRYPVATSAYDNMLEIRADAEELRALHSP